MFNPLGNFDPHAAANPAIVAKAKALFASLPDVPAGDLTRLYYHWTVAPLGMCFADYNGEARFASGEWLLTVTHDPRDNAPGLDNNAVASHTYMRNTGAIGCAITGMDGPDVSPENFGADGVSVTGLTHLCAIGAAMCAKYGIDVAGTSTGSPYGGEPTILTHAEAGDHVGSPAQYAAYGPLSTVERWDLATFVPLPPGMQFTAAMVKTCGDALRTLTRTYKVALA